MDLEIGKLTLEEAWGLFKGICPITEELYKEIRFGSVIKFDIYDYFNEFIQIKPKTREAQIVTRKVNLSDFWTELEIRERMMKEYLEEHLGTEDFTETELEDEL